MKKKIGLILDYLHRKPELTFLLIALPFGLFSAFFVPQMSVTDEDSHLLRAYQVAHGEFVCNKKMSYPEDIVSKSKSGSSGSRSYTKDFSDTIQQGNQKKYSCGSAAAYLPVAYIPQAGGILIADAFSPNTASMVLFARIMNLLFYVGAVYWVIKKVKVAKYAFFVIALIPQMIHLAASLSADTVNNVATLAAFALIINLYIQNRKISGKQVGFIFLLIAGIALLKRNLILLMVPLAFLPASLFKENIQKKIPFNLRKWGLAGLSVLTAGVLYIVWTKFLFISASSPAGGPNPIEEHPNLFINLMFNTYFSDYGDLVIRGVFGDFSSFLYHFPTILVVVQIIVLLMTYLYVTDQARDLLTKNKWLIISSTFVFIASILAITYGLYIEWGLKRGIIQYADGVQGRYFTALLILLVPLFAWISKYISISVKSDRIFFFTIVIAQVSILSFYVLYTVKLLINT